MRSILFVLLLVVYVFSFGNFDICEAKEGGVETGGSGPSGESPLHWIPAIEISDSVTQAFYSDPRSPIGCDTTGWKFWINEGPGWRYGHDMVYEESAQRTLFFGGRSSTFIDSLQGDTWAYDGVSWTLLSNSGPSPRDDHAMAFDRNRGRTVLFGGNDGSPRDDTWEWDGYSWNQVFLSGPDARYGHCMTFDDDTLAVLLFGGYDGSQLMDDLWLWDGISWNQLFVSGPSARRNAQMVFDEARGTTILFGGETAAGFSSETWEWDGTSWTLLTTDGPSARARHAMAFDYHSRKLILHGGAADWGSLPETWEWDGLEWKDISADNFSGPSWLNNHAMTYDGLRGRTVLFGGQIVSSDLSGTTWEWCCDCGGFAAAQDSLGNVVFPSYLDSITEPITYEDVDFISGDVSVLYSSFDTKLDTWYADLPCDPNIGGVLPPEVEEYDIDQELVDTLTLYNNGVPVNVTADEIADSIISWENQIKARIILEVDSLAIKGPSAPPYTPPTHPFCPDPDQNYIFGGRDIVFVHGLMTGALMDKIFDCDPGVWSEWRQPTIFPGNIENPEFYEGGYWKGKAVAYWHDHIERFFTSHNIMNRYLIVAWPSTERMEVGVQAVLAQIGDAMHSGEGVQNDLNPTDTEGFGTPSFVIVSHSTGGPLSDIAMSAAENNDNLQAGYVAEHCKAHVAYNAVFSGSRYATAAIVGAWYLSENVPEWVCPLVNFVMPVLGRITGMSCEELACPLSTMFTYIRTSVLLDLVPVVTDLKWGSYINTIPMRTVCFVGGHPSHKAPLKYILSPGFDDGVSNMNSQVANPNFPLLWPSGFRPNGPFGKLKTFDMGLWKSSHPLRAVGYFVDQVVDPFIGGSALLKRTLVASPATPYVSPSGMVQSVGKIFSGGLDPMKRYDNHYSFIQSAWNHFDVTDPLESKGEVESEETRCITDPTIYHQYLIGPRNDAAPLLQHYDSPRVQERVKGRKVSFTIKILWKKFRISWWVWRRVYHNVVGWNTMSMFEYVYQLLLRESICPGPTDIHVSSFSALNRDGYVEIRWSTASETSNTGFNIYRSTSEEGPRTRINEHLIPARGSDVQGSTYYLEDRGIEDAGKHYYWLEDISLNGQARMNGPVLVETQTEGTPKSFGLAQNHPNPFNPFTSIAYDLPTDCYVKLEVYNVLGQRVGSLVDEYQKAGRRIVYWNAASSKYASGIYFYRLRAGDFTDVKKMVLLK